MQSELDIVWMDEDHNVRKVVKKDE